MKATNGNKQPPVPKANGAEGSKLTNMKAPKPQSTVKRNQPPGGNADLNLNGKKESEKSHEEEKELLQRHSVIEQLQNQILRRGQEPNIPEEEIMLLIHGYVSTCHNEAMNLMDSQESREAGKVLRMCETFIRTKLPKRIEHFCRKRGVLHTVLNNQAQHSNMMADMDRSIEYLEKALESAEDPECDQDQLPLAETYLNLANGYSYMNKFKEALEHSEKALNFALRRCSRIKNDLAMYTSRPQGQQDHKIIENLELQLNDFIAIKIMADMAVGEQHEKLGSFALAIKQFADGKQFAQQHFGEDHPLYTKCLNAMGGARLKSKYQTKEVYRTQKDQIPNVIHTETKRKSPTRSVNSPSKKSSLSSSMRKPPRRNIKQALKEADVKLAHMRKKDNLLLTNCDTWAQVHCMHHNHTSRPRPRLRPMSGKKQQPRSTLTNVVLMKPSSKRSRPGSVTTKQQRARQMRKEMFESMKEGKVPVRIAGRGQEGGKNSTFGRNSSTGNLNRSIGTRSEAVINIQKSRIEEGKGDTARSFGQHLPPIEPARSEAGANADTKSQKSAKSDHSAQSAQMLMMQSERLHQQQMNHMRSVQEDQFRMLQLVLENSKKNENHHMSYQQPQQMFYYPQPGQMQPGQMQPGQMHPGMYPYPYQYPQQMMPPHMMYPPYYGGYGHPSHYQHPGMHNFYQGQQSESEMSVYGSEYSVEEYRQRRKHRQPDEYYDEAPSDDNDQHLDQVDAGQVKLKDKQSFNVSEIIERRKTESFKEKSGIHSAIKGGEIDELNDRASFTMQQSPGKMSMPAKVDAYEDRVEQKQMVDQSVQAMTIQNQEETMRQSIAASSKRHSTIQGTIRQQSTISKKSSLKDRSLSPSRSRKSIASPKSHLSEKSLASGSEKSFRLQTGPNLYNRKEAAIIIQKNFRGYMCRQDYYLGRRAATQRQTLFKAPVSNAMMLTCALKSQHGKMEALIFYFSGNKALQNSIEVDLLQYGPIESTNMRDKVERIIQGYLDGQDLCQGIADAFNSEKAHLILKESSSPQKQENPKITDEAPKLALKQIDTVIDKATEIELRRMQIESEIERIRKEANSQQFVVMEKVIAKGYHSRFSSPTDSEQAAEDDEISIDIDQSEAELQIDPIVIREASVRQVRRDETKDQSNDDGSSAYDSDASYKFRTDEKPLIVKKKLDIWLIVKIQSRIRGFLARLNNNLTPLLFNKVIKKDDEFVHFKLQKFGFMDYLLTAKTQFSNIYRSTRLEQLPFEEDETLEMFEECLKFQMVDDNIKELDLVYKQKIEEPIEEPGEEHFFVLDWKDPVEPGKYLIRGFVLKRGYNAQFYYCIENGKKFYQVEVHHNRSSDYIKLQNLPVDMLYMVYYLREAIGCKLKDNDTLDFVVLNRLIDVDRLLKTWEMLYRQYFGGNRKLKQVNPASKFETVDRRSVSPNIPQGDVTAVFEITRGEKTYKVEVIDNTARQNKYFVVVSNFKDQTDKDYLMIPQITMFEEELKAYLENNLKIYTDASNNDRIMYLALTDSHKMFAANKTARQIRLNSRYGKTKELNSETIQPGIIKKVIRHADGKIAQFEIERQDITYDVKVDHKDGNMDRIQVTAINQNNKDDQDYIDIRNPKLEKKDLVQYLSQRLVIITKPDEASGQLIFERLALSAEPDGIRRSMSISSTKKSGVSQKQLAKKRANRGLIESVNSVSSKQKSKEDKQSINQDDDPFYIYKPPPAPVASQKRSRMLTEEQTAPYTSIEAKPKSILKAKTKNFISSQDNEGPQNQQQQNIMSDHQQKIPKPAEQLEIMVSIDSSVNKHLSPVSMEEKKEVNINENIQETSAQKREILKQTKSEAQAQKALTPIIQGHLGRKAAQEKRDENIRVENAFKRVSNVFAFLSLKANLDDGKVHLTITDNTKRNVFINRHELPKSITGDLSDPEEVDIQLKAIKEKCMKLLEENQQTILVDKKVPRELMVQGYSMQTSPSQHVSFNLDSQPTTFDQNEVLDTQNSETSMYFDAENKDFNFNKGTPKKPTHVIVQRKVQELKEIPAIKSEESDQFSEDSFSIKKAMGTVKGENGKYYRLTIDIKKGKYVLTLGQDRGGIICKDQNIPQSFVYYQIEQDEDQAIVLQTCKERVETLVRNHVQEIEQAQGQISDSWFNTDRLPNERVGMI